jgi:hypothetical protein
MKKLLISALLAAILCVPTFAQAGIEPVSHTALRALPRAQSTVTAPSKVSPDSARDYAAREAAAPQLAEFAGGGGGIYVGTGVLVVALVVVVIILVLR